MNCLHCASSNVTEVCKETLLVYRDPDTDEDLGGSELLEKETLHYYCYDCEKKFDPED